MIHKTLEEELEEAEVSYTMIPETEVMERQTHPEFGIMLRDSALLDCRNIYRVFRQLKDLKVRDYFSIEGRFPNSNAVRTIRTIAKLYEDCPELLWDYYTGSRDRRVTSVVLLAYLTIKRPSYLSPKSFPKK